MTFWRHFGIWMVLGYILEGFLIHFGNFDTTIGHQYRISGQILKYSPKNPIFHDAGNFKAISVKPQMNITTFSLSTLTGKIP